MQHHRVISAVKRQSGTRCRALKSVCAVFSQDQKRARRERRTAVKLEQLVEDGYVIFSGLSICQNFEGSCCMPNSLAL